MGNTAEFIIAIAGIIFASTGFWTFLLNIIQNKSRKQDALIKLMLGIGHEKIIELGLRYIERGYVTKDEYEDLVHYLYDPYIDLGGDGTVEKIMLEVKQLPIHKEK